MQLTKSQVNAIRYLSANGKISFAERLPHIASQNLSNLKYLGPATYKTLPISTPNELPNCKISFDVFEKMLEPLNESKSNIYSTWFSLLEPREIKLTKIQKEMSKIKDETYINKIEFLKTFNKEEKEKIANIASRNAQFLATITGHKPANFLEGGVGNIDFSKIKLNPKYKDKIDCVKPKRFENGLYILNKPLVMDIIKENKDIYCLAQKLDMNSDLETIYQALLKNLESGNAPDVLFGMTLGFPRNSSIIFDIERLQNKGMCDLRSDIITYKNRILELLYCENSPYKDYPKEFLTEIENYIRNIEEIGSGCKEVYQFIRFGKEENAMKKIQAQEDDFINNFKVEELF